MSGPLGHDTTVREAAAHAVAVPLHAWRPAAGALVPVLIAAQQDPAEAVRLRTLRHLAGAGRAATGASDLLWAAVERGPVGSEDSAWASERTLGAAALTALSRLRDPRADAYLAARLRARPLRLAQLADALSALGPWAEMCRAVIVDAVEAADAGYDRARLIRAAGRVGADPAALVPVLQRQAAEHSYSAGILLGDLGPAAAAALPELTALRASDDADRQRIAARALWWISGDPDDLLGVLRNQIRDRHSLEILAEVGPHAVELADLLPPIFDSDDEWRVIHAAIAYWHITGDADPVVPTLVRYTECCPWGVLAVRALADIGPAAAAAIPVLRAHAESPYRQLWWRWGAEDSLVAEDEGWAAVCTYALARIQGAETGDWPDVLLPEPAHQP
ncbi:hypothetical protein [Micromonospora sp. NPDC007230]|uniref:hypothetical protein n=1 Tax=Micromonospora sp. NPDC007230 TaxID=3364237 RepID=UPI003699CC76